MLTSVAVEMECMRRRGSRLLQLGERVVGLHRLLEGAGRAAEFVVKFAYAIERDFGHEEIEVFLFQGLGNLHNGAVGEVSVGGNVDLADLVVADELAADFAELGAQKRLAAGEIEILDAAERAGKREDFLFA